MLVSVKSAHGGGLVPLMTGEDQEPSIYNINNIIVINKSNGVKVAMHISLCNQIKMHKNAITGQKKLGIKVSPIREGGKLVSISPGENFWLCDVNECTYLS